MDQRPLHILEEKLRGLSQGNLSIEYYYRMINETLSSIQSKLHATFNNEALTAMLIKVESDAVRTFIDGLNNINVRMTIQQRLSDTIQRILNSIASTTMYEEPAFIRK
ncbi:hypothetical protein, partial [Nocardia blacklockiae]|uniref:hypothetical protein n=1 Tax=Nocardia blacklockiae TaxID=480036 RepID=UPI001E5E720D